MLLTIEHIVVVIIAIVVLYWLILFGAATFGFLIKAVLTIFVVGFFLLLAVAAMNHVNKEHHYQQTYGAVNKFLENIPYEKSLSQAAVHFGRTLEENPRLQKQQEHAWSATNKP
ncbi:hypothetical protein BBC27_08365 [Acidithiobacillus ferrivorans]|uniref:Uncharacterized protein n=1 Tax=Acidithiobacillus ferrivorans TaxID=160808 RepID=A0A1B9C0B2_9PROT|nr:hypothetical protein [Acidithiobacillus ferrivorans]OCB03353.1 hypothetical protein BBC27_08365 [Acidithiobacillus ferrivorans]